MRRKVCIILLFAVCFPLSFLIGQVFPPDQAQLNYTEILFHWPAIVGANVYTLEIQGKPTHTEKEVTTFHINTKVEDTQAQIRLSFGYTYTWKVSAWRNDTHLKEVSVATFSIPIKLRADSNRYRHLIVKDKLPIDTDLYVFIDNPGVLIDKKGEPIWVYPVDTVGRVFNLQLLPNGNIACLRPKGRKSGNENLMFEVFTIDGQKVWQGPDEGTISGDSSEFYHHDFQALSNGNYLLVGNHFHFHHPKGARGPLWVKMGTILEYNAKGDLLWSWESFDHLDDRDVFEAGLKDNPVHLNGIFYEEQTTFLYASFRYIDRVVKIEKASGKIVHSFGRKMPSGQAHSANDFFHQQHSPYIEGDIMYIYDNSTGKGADSVSSAVIIEMPKDTTQQGKILYRYPFNFGSRQQSWSESKGDIDKISSSLLLATMGSIPRTVVIDTTQGIVWQCEHQFRTHPEADWRGVQENYRADWTTTLYPVNMTLRLGEWKKKDRKKRYLPKISIVNKGTQADSYVLQGKDEEERVLFRKKVPSISPNEQWQASIRIKKRDWRQAKKIRVEVISVHNSLIRREGEIR